MPDQLPWPADSVVIVASVAGTEVRSQMEGVHPATCRHCGGPVHADTFTVRRAFALPARMGRPLSFLCLSCLPNYAFPGGPRSVVEFHNTPAGKAEAAAEMAAGR